jgi:hypothetical protein
VNCAREESKPAARKRLIKDPTDCKCAGQLLDALLALTNLNANLIHFTGEALQVATIWSSSISGV